MKFSKLSTVFWAAALVLVAYLSREVRFVLNAAFSLRGLTSGALLGGLCLTLFWKRSNALPLVLAMILSLILMIAISLHWFKTTIDWPWFTLIGTATTLGAASLFRLILPGKPALSPSASDSAL